MILWFTVCRIDDLSENRMTYFDVERCHVVVVLTSEGEVVAFDGICPHKGAFLEKGEFLGDRVRCPWHGYEFDIRTGLPVTVPYTEKYGEWRNTGNLRLLKVRTKHGLVEIWLDEDRVN